jgi:hypothetical protein
LTLGIEWVIIDVLLASCWLHAPLGFSHHERTKYREDSFEALAKYRPREVSLDFSPRFDAAGG